MQECTLKVIGRDGLHARPAAHLVERVKQFACEITIEKDGRTANGKSMLGIIALGIAPGSTITVTTEGADEQAAIDVIREFVETGQE